MTRRCPCDKFMEQVYINEASHYDEEQAEKHARVKICTGCDGDMGLNEVDFLDVT